MTSPSPPPSARRPSAAFGSDIVGLPAEALGDLLGRMLADKSRPAPDEAAIHTITEVLAQLDPPPEAPPVAPPADSESIDFAPLLRPDAPAPAIPAEGGLDMSALLTTVKAALAATGATEDEEEEEEDVLLLDESFALPATIPAKPAPGGGAAEPVLALAESFLAGLSALPDTRPEKPAPPTLLDIIQRTTSAGSGTLDLPERGDALLALLADPPPADDFAALDLLYACWPRGTTNCTSRALLAAALALSHNFGLPGKLPMAASRAWRMLDPTVFELALANRLEAIAAFIFGWQQARHSFLILDFGEIELIEYLFEALHPGDHQRTLATVMTFKVLSNRRLGLLRRIPGRARKAIQPMLPDDRDGALVTLAHYKALLEAIAEPTGFAPVVEAASRARDDIERQMKTLATPPGGGGLTLGRIGG